MIVVAAPIADRAWILPDYYRHLAAQTMPPNRVVFLWSSMLPNCAPDETFEAIHRCARDYGLPTAVLRDHHKPHYRHDNARFETLAELRNTLLAFTRLSFDPDVYFSLDTDVLLTDPQTIERLVGVLQRGEGDTASPITWLHPLEKGSWAVNAGWWAESGSLGDPRRPWQRAGQAVTATSYDIDIPMAAVAMNRRVLDSCRYRTHESGEDLGFAQDLERFGMSSVWLTDLEARHVWEPSAL